MNELNDIIDSNSLSADDEILRYLKGKLSKDEEASFFERMQSDAELKSKTIVMARLVKGLKEVGDEQDKVIKDSFLASSENEIKAAINSATHKEKSNVFTIKKTPVWISIAASFAFVIWSGIGFYDRQQTVGLGNEYANIFSTTSISRDAQSPSEAEMNLTRLFDNIANKKDMDNTLHELSLYWELSTMETYNDYTDFATEIGWNLAVGYLKDNDKKNATKTLEEFVQIVPEESTMSIKAHELLNKIN